MHDVISEREEQENGARRECEGWKVKREKRTNIEKTVAEGGEKGWTRGGGSGVSEGEGGARGCLTLGGGWNVVGSYQHNVDTNSLLLPRVSRFRRAGGSRIRSAGELGGGGGREWMKLKWNYPKEQTAPRVSEPGERLKRDRMDAKESFTMRPLFPLHCRTMRRPNRRGTDSRISESFPYEVWDDTFLR